MTKTFLALFLFLFLLSIGSAFAQREIFERYFQDTYQGIEGMRNKTSGLVVDSALANLFVLNDNTSPSNIGLDLLVQLEALQMPEFRDRAQQNIRNVLLTLGNLRYHESSGLFYNRYSSDGNNVADSYVSSVDNLHLAFALWVVSESHPGLEESYVARTLFKRFNFSSLYNSGEKLFAGGFYYRNGKWIRESWHYDYFGSEGRSLYSVGSAIGLINEDSFPPLTIEMNGPLLRLWDGGAFQLLLPRLLVNEDYYSQRMKIFYTEYAQLVLEKGRRNGWPVPASHSACQISMIDYNGKSGSPELVASKNYDVISDEVFTPHAALIAAPLMPKTFAKIMLSAEDLGVERKLYIPGLGWLDGYHVKGKDQGKVVPVFLSLDQTMIALAMAQAISFDGLTAGNRALFRNNESRTRLHNFYKQLDTLINFY